MHKIVPIDIHNPQIIEKLKEIFFLTSSVKTFQNEEAKENFFHKYLGIYLEKSFPWNLMAMDGNEVLGYIVGDCESKSYYVYHPYLSKFDDLIEKYPAHLHINLHPKSQGLGIGSKLIQEYELILKKLHIQGLHLITTQSDRNVYFYLKNGFNFNEEREFHQGKLFFMAKLLTP